ncbi:hypothetical protein EG329_011831 [Mollisiaceae sp. DMI_Dod_QoI]|nr:hypothetical protein EG329_011831 [Helotiales sp. DMI_Dod_QoI]
MLTWWLGKPADNRVQDENTELLEPPETPAPVFAARALKSAIFGTPARPDDTICDTEGEIEVENEPRSMSPTKPPGILLTPGTATMRRKTVSFDHEVVDKEQQRTTFGKPGSKSGLPDDCPGKFPSPWVPKSEVRKSKRKTTLTKTLEDAREGKAPKVSSDSRRTSFESEPAIKPQPEPEVVSSKTSRRSSRSEKRTQQLLQEMAQENKIDSDMTTDLNEPHSQSGKYWKSEYEQYHEQARAEMKKLLYYKALAKSYAQAKDNEAIDLAAKLKEEQKKVLEMESRISQLSAKIAQSGRDGQEGDSPALIKELARQTAHAVQYKGQVEEFRVALEENDFEVNPCRGDMDGKRFASPRTEQTILDTHPELKRARDQLRDMTALREEVQKLRQAVSDAEKNTTKLQAENTKLTQELLHADLRLEKHLEKCEKKRRQSDEHKQKREEALQNLQKDYDQLKEHAKTNRREAEHLLKKRHDQVVNLKKEIASLRGSESSIQELQQALQKKSLGHEQLVEKYKKQTEDLKKGIYTEPDAVGMSEDKMNKEDVLLPPREWFPPKESPVRESQIPVPAQSIPRPLKTFSSKLPLAEDSPQTPRHRASHPALSEIINNANVDTLPPPRYGPVQHTPIPSITPLSDHFSNSSSKEPKIELPSLEPSTMPSPALEIHARNSKTSPRPSIFNIASSPPKAALMRTHASNELSRKRSNNNLGSRRPSHIISGRISGQELSKMRVPLPPERAAAAKARLEAKLAEKRQAQAQAQAIEAGKENV